MAWIESHQELGRHPKLARLARHLGISRVAAVGHLHYFWWWCVDFAQDGSLTDYTSAEIAEAAQWEGDPSDFVDAMGAAGWIDLTAEGNSVHDWYEYFGRLLEQREKNAEKQKRYRQRKTDREPEDEGVTVTLPSALPSRDQATVPNRTKPNRTKPNHEEPEEPFRGASAPKERKPHPHATQIAALQEALGVTELSCLTSGEKGKFFRAAKMLSEAHRSREDIMAAKQNWYAGMTCTALGLANNITDLLRVPPRGNGKPTIRAPVPLPLGPPDIVEADGSIWNADGTRYLGNVNNGD